MGELGGYFCFTDEQIKVPVGEGIALGSQREHIQLGRCFHEEPYPCLSVWGTVVAFTAVIPPGSHIV